VNGPHVHIPFQRIPEYIDFIRKTGLNLEIYFGSAVLDTVSINEVSSVREELGQSSVSIHAPFMDLSPGAVDSKVRAATLERFTHVLDISEVLKPRAIVFHSGYEKWKYALNVDIWLEKSLMTWRPLNERAAGMGVTIAVENIFEDEPSNLKLLMEGMESKNFGVCFDTGHFNIFSRVPLEEWIETLNPYIVELHLHDNDRKSDQHRAMGEGIFDFRKLFRLLKNRDCIRTIEAHTPDAVLKSVEYLKDITMKKT
jgi:sugar phosphate isomerase/epimerase